MFVKKLVEKASLKKTSGGNSSEGVKGSDVEPRLVFHHGIPCASTIFAYDPIQNILAISSKDGRIKLFGRDNTQALLQSQEPEPTKFLQVWDIENKILSHVLPLQQEITSFTVIQQTPFIYLGDNAGNVSVLKLEKEMSRIVQTSYNIPFSASHGNSTEVSGENAAVTNILPQPMAESKRVLMVFRDGLITLWDIRESKSIFTAGENVLQSLHHEAKKATYACWACPFGTRVVVGYNNGEIFVWSVPPIPNSKTGIVLESATQNAPICKLNVGYKLNKIPIASLKWAYANGKASRLYVLGASNFESENLSQVILLNEHTESRTIKLALHLPEPCSDMEIISGSSEQNKHRQEYFLLLGKSGHIYAYDDSSIEKYLLQCQSRSQQSLPKEVMVKTPFSDSSITAAKFLTDNPCLGLADEDYVQLAKDMPHMFSFEANSRDGSPHFSGFLRVKNLYITGHSDGAITFWDVSSPVFVPIISLKQQSEDDSSLSGIAVTALFFDGNSRLLISGDHSGMVRVYKLKPEPYSTENSFLSLQGGTKKGNSHVIQSIKLIKTNGAVVCMNISHSSRHLAVGSDQGYVSVIDIEGPTLLCQQHIESEICTGVIALRFHTCSLHGFEKNVLVVATKDSSLLALDSDTGNKLSTSTVHPKKPSKALFMHILDGQDTSGRGSNTLNGFESSKGNAAEDAMPKQSLLLLCSEKALYLYSFTHVIQGVKKVICKKKFHSSCFWASTFYCSTDVGLVLLFTNGKIEIRSLPELTLLKETWIRGFTYSTPKPNSLSKTSICSSLEGDIVMVNNDQEIFVVSVLSHKKIFRLLDSFNQIYRKDLAVSQEGLVSPGPIIHKEKKKGIFSSVIKDITGSKSKPVPDHMETEDARQSLKDLETVFSAANIPSDAEHTDKMAADEEDVELDIDDIDIEITAEKPKEQNILAALNKQNLASKFQVLKGKLKHMKTKNEKNFGKEEEQDEKCGTVDQIKRKYGFSKAGETSVAKIAESKLQDNVRKLQGINLRATEMQDTAQSFSYLAKQVLQTEQDRRGS
ncbi:Guanine nucleotide-binding protein, beta subunit [Trema orientale]|uniref:Guanine nucleotide-binding protein, beta subunit n=1 Tax=Trema orientale TaxID=63057 RepID=A0A2P5EB03_TREOI|nr:Guanine nucleotide-binding protein, beta subunit [Trema orientale]